MNFNIRYDTEIDGVNKWDNRRSFVLKAIQDFNPDLLGTQEAMKSQVDYLSSNLTKYHSIGTDNCDCREQYDSLLFVKKARYEILEERHFWLSTTPYIPFTNDFVRTSPRPSNGPRTMSCVELLDRIDNYTLFFCNTHWDGDVLSNEQSADLTKQIFTQYGKKINILTGDFNEFPFNYNVWPQTPDWIATRQSHAYDTLMSFMIDGFKQLRPNNIQSSGCGWDLDCPVWDNDYRIDWILHSKNIHTQESKISIERRPNGLPVSDHFPVISILEVVSER
jgi:endonuclease/exonuclease/phosphatase family metal-dependent hydrolase